MPGGEHHPVCVCVVVCTWFLYKMSGLWVRSVEWVCLMGVHVRRLARDDSKHKTRPPQNHNHTPKNHTYNTPLKKHPPKHTHLYMHKALHRWRHKVGAGDCNQRLMFWEGWEGATQWSPQKLTHLVVGVGVCASGCQGVCMRVSVCVHEGVGACGGLYTIRVCTYPV